MLRIRKLSWAATAIAAVILLPIMISNCSDDADKGSTPTGDPGIYGAIADTLEYRVDKCVRDHEEYYESLDYFAPKIRAILAQAAGQQKTTGERYTSCWASSVVGRSFQYNGTAYVGVDNDSLGSNARFILYRLGTNGAPMLSDTVGDIRLNCIAGESGNEILLQLQSGPKMVAVFQYFQVAGGVSDLSGTLNAVEYFPTYVQGSTDLAGYVLRFSGESGGSVGLQRQVMSADDTRIEAYFVVAGGGWVSVPSTDFRMYFHVNSQEDVTEGYATYYDNTQSGQVACISSGSLDAPNFTQPAAQCSADSTHLAINQAELAAMRQVYAEIYELWSRVNVITDITQLE